MFTYHEEAIMWESLPPSGYGCFRWTDQNNDKWFLIGSASKLPKELYDKWVKENPLPLFEQR